jgi:hypothetical protein
LDGKRLSIANEPFLFDGSVYLPVREIADFLNCTVKYNEATNVIGIAYDEKATASGSSAVAAPQTPTQASGTAPQTPTQASGTAPQTQAQPSVTSPPSAPAQPASPAQPPADNSAAAKPSTDGAGSFSSADLAFIIKDKTVKLDQNISVVKDLLGAPKDYEEVESCAYSGLDKFYIFDGVEVRTLPIDGDSICAIDVLKNSVKTAKGITVGSALSQIEAAYGKDYTLENGVLIYWAGPKGNPKTPQLYFMLDKNNAVETFGMYNGKSAG